MKNITRILIALVLILIPPLATYFWYYQGFYHRTQPVDTPAYSDLEVLAPPLSTQPAPVKGSIIENYVVLVDFEHDNNFVLSEIENLTQPLARRGAKLEVANFELALSDRLKYTDAYVVIAPTTVFTQDEIRAIQRFVQRGGRLLVIADPTRNYYAMDLYSFDTGASSLSGVDVANLLLAAYDIAFNEDYVYNLVENEANYRNVYFDTFDESAITGKLSKIVLYGAHSLHTTGDVLISGDKNTLSSATDQGGNLVVAAAGGSGNVIALGDLNFLTVPYHQVADNYQLIINLIDFLLGAQRSYDLADFPYLFHNSLNILTPADDVTDKDFITTLNDIQLTLEEMDLSVKVSEDIAEDEDLLVTGTFSQRHDLKEYLDPFQLEFSRELIQEETAVSSIFDTPQPTPTPLPTEYWVGGPGGNTQDTVMVPGLGKFNINDVGLVLLTSAPEKSIMTLLASNSEAVRELADIVFKYRDLSSCLTTDTIAVCNLESGSPEEEEFYFNENDYDLGNGYDEMGEATPTPFELGTPVPEVTPLGLR